MKQSTLFITIALLISFDLQAQYRKSIIVKAGEDIAQAFSPNGFFRFAEFDKGILFSRKQSGNSRQLFNYNILSGKVQFINPKGDTLEMTNPGVFDSLMIGKTVFYYVEDLGFLEQLGAAGPVNLVKKTTIKIKPETVGAYGSTTSTSSIDKIDTYVVGGRVYNYRVNEDMNLKEMIDWYWITPGRIPQKATRKNLLQLLPRTKQPVAEALIKEQKTNFDKEADLIRLIQTIQGSTLSI